MLNHSEIIGSEDVCISVRVVSFLNKFVSRPISVTVVRTTKIQELFAVLLGKFPSLAVEPQSRSDMTEEELKKNDFLIAFFSEARLLSVAKTLSTGANLSLKGALKLKWNDDQLVTSSSSPIGQMPLNLRDGSVLVIRSEADFSLARDAAKAKAAERPNSVQGDSPARGRVRPTTRGRVRLATKEKGIKISTDSGAPPPPKPSPIKGGATGFGDVENFDRQNLDYLAGAEECSGGNGLPIPVRMVKVLRSPRAGEEA